MEIALRNRIAVGVFATVVIVGSGVATALVTSSDAPTVGEAVDTTASTGDTVGSTLPSTPSSTVVTTPDGATGDTKVDGGDTDETPDVARYWDSEECGGDEIMNHGQYVSSEPRGGDSRRAAAHSDCGKPLTSVGGEGDDGDHDTPEVDAPDDDGDSTPSAAPGKSGSAPGHNK